MADLFESVIIPIVVGTAAGFGGSSLRDVIKKRMDKRDVPTFDLDRFQESSDFLVGIHNTDKRSIDACTIHCD